MASTLLERRALCQDRSLRERMSQALLEAGKTTTVDSALALGVAALEAASADLSAPITDEMIISFVATLP